MTQHYQGKQRAQARTVNELTPAIGQYVYVRFESISVGCLVKDAKQSWGKVRLLVSPADGQGEQWIELERLLLPIVAPVSKEVVR